jgi:CheY-like chemotaxis protein
MRVGADAYYTAPVDTESVVRRISQLAKVGNDAAYRVLVVEDDPSQAKFAATILRKGGMETEVVTEPLDTMGAIKRFKPDLVLMDVYMPNASGIELTRIIRQDKRLLTLPIVYLSGEQNPEKQQTALSVGADDFIAKPIRPKHLIGTVTNRIRRAQQLQDGLSEAEEPRTDPATGLTSKQYFFECIDALLSGSAGGDPPSAMVHIDIADFPALRTQLSGGALDSLLSMVGKRISNQLNPGEVATRSAENSFALLLRQPTGGSIRPVVDRMVRSLAEPPFEIDGRPLRLKASSKLWPLHRGDTAPGAASPTGERAATPGANVPGAPATARNRDAMIAQVREAIKAGRLELGLRQISGPEGQTPRGYELAPLVPADGATPAIPAQEVRRIAAEAGLIGALDRYSVARAIAFLDDPRGPGERTLLVRVSPRAMMEPESLQALRDGLRVRHLVGSGLVFGLSLAEIGADPKAIRSLVRTLKEMGIATALTRFTGSEAAMRLLTFLEAPYVEADVTVVRKGTAALAPLVEAAHRAGALVMMAEDWVPQGTKRSASYGADLWVGRSVRPPAAVAGDAIGSATD